MTICALLKEISGAVHERLRTPARRGRMLRRAFDR